MVHTLSSAGIEASIRLAPLGGIRSMPAQLLGQPLEGASLAPCSQHIPAKASTASLVTLLALLLKKRFSPTLQAQSLPKGKNDHF